MNSQRLFCIKKWNEMFVLKFSGIQKDINQPNWNQSTRKKFKIKDTISFL